MEIYNDYPYLKMVQWKIINGIYNDYIYMVQ